MNKNTLFWIAAGAALYLLTRRSSGVAGLGQMTRPSCRECVDKHIGSAWVLCGECLDGYDHRLMAIGHLAQAEEESQAWPILHNAIRQERKKYQQNGIMPDFQKLSALCAGCG